MACVHMVPGLDLTQELRTAFADAEPEQVLARLERVTRYDYGREGLYNCRLSVDRWPGPPAISPALGGSIAPGP